MSLHVDRSGTGHRIVLAHGFTQNGRCWGNFAEALAGGHGLHAVDLPGHGRSDPTHDRADLPAAGRLLAEAGDRAVYLGYSMGARVALHTALARPGLVDGLVLVGATAGLDDPRDRAARRRADETLAAELTSIGLAAFLDRWLANPLFSGLDEAAACRTERLTNRVEGLAASLRNCGTGTQQPLWERLEEITAPVLLLVGDDDAKFTALAHRMAGRLPRAEVVSLPGTHAIHLEQPLAAAAVVERFVASTG